MEILHVISGDVGVSANTSMAAIKLRELGFLFCGAERFLFVLSHCGLWGSVSADKVLK